MCRRDDRTRMERKKNRKSNGPRTHTTRVRYTRHGGCVRLVVAMWLIDLRTRT